MKLFINLIVLICQWQVIFSYPGIVESSIDYRKNHREKVSSISTRLPLNPNAIKTSESFEPKSTTTPPTTPSLQTFKLTHEDVVMGANSVYGSHFQPSSSTNSQLAGGGILFAVSGGQEQGMTSPPLMSAAQAQPVLLQYLSPEGTPKQSTIQYIQLLRPLMMLPAPPQFLQPRPMQHDDIQTEAKVNPFAPPHIKSSLIGAHSIPLTSYSRPLSAASTLSHAADMSLNMYEYMPAAASSRVSTTIFNPNTAITTIADKMGFKPTNHFQMMAQRA